jgi:outer membrane lipoprotein SlyB
VKRRPLRHAKTVSLKGIPRARVLTGATISVAVLALSGCQLASPIQTNVPYQSADGVAVDLGDVQVRDLVIVTDAKGGVGTLSGLVVNRSAAPVTVTFATGPGALASTRAVIPAGAPTRLSGVEGVTPVTIPSVPAAPGDMVSVVVSTPDAGAPVVSVPVLLPTGYYSSITPPPVQTTPPEPVPTTTPAPIQTTSS